MSVKDPPTAAAGVAVKRKRRDNVVSAEKRAKREERQKKKKVNAAENGEASKDEPAKKAEEPVLLVDVLNSRSPGDGLLQLAGATDDNDLVEEFFSGGGQVGTLLRLLDLREGRAKPADVELVFRACQTVIIRVVRSENPSLAYGGRGLTLCQQLTKRILDDYMREMNVMLSEQGSDANAVAVLRLLTAMVTIGVSTARLLLLKLEWDKPAWENLPKRASQQIIPDVRTSFIHFLLAFLMEPNQILLKEFFERKSLLTSIYAGLVHDPSDTVQLVLETFRCKILQNLGVSKTYKMRVFGSHNLQPILALFNWRGPKLVNETKSRPKKKKKMGENDGEEEDGPDEEELEDVKQSLAEFLRLLLTTSKFGVVFQDPEYGCERDSNPLIKEVLTKVDKPWEMPDLARLISEILAANPDKIQHFLSKMTESWEPRSSVAWTKLMDFLYVVFSNLSIENVLANFKRSNKVAVHILRNIVLPLPLLIEVLTPGVSSPLQDVSRQSLELLDVILRNTEKFVAGAEKDFLHRELSHILRDRLPTVDVLNAIWRREIQSTDQKYIPHVLAVITFHTRYCGSVGQNFNIVQILHDLQLIHLKTKESMEDGLEHMDTSASRPEAAATRPEAAATRPEAAATRQDPRVQTLKIVVELLKQEKYLGSFFNSFLSAETFTILLECIRTGEEEERGVAAAILETLAARADISLKHSLDLRLLLSIGMEATASVNHVDWVSRVLNSAVINKDRMVEQMEGYTAQDHEKFEQLLDELMKTDAILTDKDEDLAAQGEEDRSEDVVEGVSPLVLALLETTQDGEFNPIVERVLECLLLLVRDRQPLLSLINKSSNTFTNKFLKRVQALSDPATQVSNKIKLVEFLTPEMAERSLVLSHVLAVKLTGLGRTRRLAEFLASLGEAACREVVERLINTSQCAEYFSPFKQASGGGGDADALVLMMLGYRKQFNICADRLSKRVIELAEQLLDDEEEEEGEGAGGFDGETILKSFDCLAFRSTDLVILLNKLAKTNVRHFLTGQQELSRKGFLLAAVLGSLADTSHDALPSQCLASLSSLLEYLVLHNPAVLGPSLTRFITAFPVACTSLDVNLLTVCCGRTDNPVCRELVVLLAANSEAMMEELKTWLTSQKKEANSEKGRAEAFLRLLQRLLAAYADAASGCVGWDLRSNLLKDSKVVKVVIKHLLNSAATCLADLESAVNQDGESNTSSSDHLIMVVDLIDVLRPSLTASTKVKKAVSEFLTSHKDSMKKLSLESSQVSWTSRRLIVHLSLVLLSAAGDSGAAASKKELLQMALVPSIRLVSVALSSAVKDSEEWKLLQQVCRVGIEACHTQTHGAVKNYLVKQKAEWSTFIKNVLKYGLKERTEAVGAPCLQLLGVVCSLRYRPPSNDDEDAQDPEDLEEMSLIVDMLVNHSGYLPTILGQASTTKLRVVELLASLAPASCSQDQLPPLLSGYNATLSPTDKAILGLLCRMEQHGVRVGLSKPVMFGRLATRQLSQGSARVSECLLALNKDLMARTVDNFPLHLTLDPTQDCDISAEQEQLYDPRFILPYISSLTGGDVYVDRHMKLVESGCLSLAVMSLASQDSDVRAMGYHILHRFYTVMEAGKLMSEKQIWLHLVNCIKNGLTAATQSKSCLKLPAVTTLFLARSILIIANPSNPMYKSISWFLMAKPALNLFSVPEFLRLFHSQELTAQGQQAWILTLLRDGLRDRLDHQMYVQSYVYKLLLSYLGSSLANRTLGVLVLEVMERASSLASVGHDLVANHGLLQYLAALSSKVTDRQMSRLILNILDNLSSLRTEFHQTEAVEGEVEEAEELATKPRIDGLKRISDVAATFIRENLKRTAEADKSSTDNLRSHHSSKPPPPALSAT